MDGYKLALPQQMLWLTAGTSLVPHTGQPQASPREGQAIYPLSIAPNFNRTDILDMANGCYCIILSNK
jgi:hypothetical protein